jgi:hypothetical protein
MGYGHHMARQRRGGFRTPELRGTLGTLLRTTREVLSRGAREGRERLDEALAGRRRGDALAELGEIVLDLVRRGEIDVEELPEARDVIAHLDELDAEAGEEAPVARAPIRRRFDDRPAPAKGRVGARGAGRKSDEDGTVAATTWAPPTRAKAASPAGPAGPGVARVWRPPAAAAPPAAADDATDPGRPAVRRGLPKQGARKGGISFDDDDSDLAEYMHPDDVPPKPKDPSDGDS